MTADHMPVQRIRAIQHDMIPPNRTDMGKQGRIEPLLSSVPMAEDRVAIEDVAREDRCQQQDETTRATPLVLPVRPVGLAALARVPRPGQRRALLALEQPAPDPL